ncbi:MAG: ribulose-phosphate 3-epimerase [Candidatus Gracilibacteria bacterium]|jgi:ribulose-phosphate 3-epimerase
MPPALKIAPSILSADFGKLNEEIASVESASEWLHIDVMDNHFVPNLTIGADVVKCLQTKLVKDCHLMVSNPESLLEDFAEAGADYLTFHIEACENPEEMIEKIKALGMKPGISIKPKTEVSAIEKYLDEIDLVLVMSVEPGFGGQKFMESALPKIQQLRKLKPELNISIDGGINAETAKLAREAGANILVAGNAIFKAENRLEAIREIRGS